MSYDRYNGFRRDSVVKNIPSVKLTPKTSDFFEIYERGKTKLNNISYEYYGDSNYDWLIMLANPQYGGLEFNIPNGSELRIPYPLDISLEDYQNQINKYKILYGIDE